MKNHIILIVLLGLFSVKSSIVLVTGCEMLGSPILWLCLQIIFILYFGTLSARVIQIQSIENLRYIYLYLIYACFVILRGSLIASTYWDWKILYENSFGLLMPVFVIGLIGPKELRNILLFFIPYALLIFIPIACFINYDNYGFYYAPLSVIVLFSPAFRFNRNLLLFGVALLVILVDLTARSNVVKIVFPYCLLVMHILNTRIVNLLVRTLHSICILFPVVLVCIAAVYEINVFDVQSNLGYSINLKSNSEVIEEEDLFMDTRSFMFIESFLTANEFDSWIYGRTPIHGQISPSYADFDMNGRDERVVNESAIINIFNWSGLVGVVLYFCVFLTSSIYGVYKSNNVYLKTIGLFISFRWLYSWVEDVNSFSLNYFTLCLILLIPLVKKYRKMTDEDVKLWLR